MNKFHFEHASLEEKLVEMILVAGRQSMIRLDAALQEVNLSGPKMWALHQLVRTAEPMPITDLARCMRSGKSNITQLMDRLEAENLVRRVPNPDDRRSVLVEITEEGRERFEAGEALHREAAQEIMAALPLDDREQMAFYLEKFIRTF
ncbi:MAG: hypothetical protein OHK0046_16800 [Anaerolineae bacterium]